MMTFFRAQESVSSAQPYGKSWLTHFDPAIKSWNSIAELGKMRSFSYSMVFPLSPVMDRNE
jgi:hypothetical protein